MNAESKFMTFHNETGKDFFFKLLGLTNNVKLSP